ncbi:unnamed protein product [marine sediment metagenome]|uniref:Four helix bundle protein n=1 Tax=marine sediment metagenome TaxID=412755 RepID=X1HY17_9ZZZZ
MAEGFEGLEVYQEARTLRARIFRLSRQLPAEEKFVLVAQMRRAALSVTNNIAEGHGSRSYRHNMSYLYRARGSLNELLDDMSACEDQGYFKKEHLDDLRRSAEPVAKLINGYVAYLRKRLREVAATGPAQRTS